jgi:hypothetical protein
LLPWQDEAQLHPSMSVASRVVLEDHTFLDAMDQLPSPMSSASTLYPPGFVPTYLPMTDDDPGVALSSNDAVSFDYTGQEAGVSLDYTGQEAGMSFDYTGQEAGVSFDYTGQEAGVSFDYTGQEAGVYSLDNVNVYDGSDNVLSWPMSSVLFPSTEWDPVVAGETENETTPTTDGYGDPYAGWY